MTDYQPIVRSTRMHGRYAIGEHELATGDAIEWLENNLRRNGTVEYTYAGYFVRTESGSIPLRELVQRRTLGIVRTPR